MSSGPNMPGGAASRPDHPGVLIPPPLIFLVPLLVGFLVGRRWPWPILPEPGPALVAAGVLAIGAALVLALSAVATFRRRGTTILPVRRPTRAIVDSGPYRFTRNPMYVGMAVAYVGGSLLLNSVWPLLLLPLAVLAVDRYVIAREERYLGAKFGDEYAAYTRRVRRWL
jgi:protein-S-isoprenylcysteine O-methyltransferase Ste14